MSQHDRYISPFSTRYSSDEMQYIFSDDNKFRTWRRLWVALARAEMEQGLTNITPEMVAELEAHVDDINYDVAIAREKLVRHDVMSHVYAYGQQCPKAAGIIHLGATSCYVGDNTDIIVMRQGLELIRKKLIGVLAKLAHFAKEYKDMPCMAYTHCQPAQPTTCLLYTSGLQAPGADLRHRRRGHQAEDRHDPGQARHHRYRLRGHVRQRCDPVSYTHLDVYKRQDFQ